MLGGQIADPMQLPEGDLREAYLEAASFRRAVKVQDALAKEAAAHLKQLEKYLACVKRVSAGPGSAERISAAAAEVAAFIKFIAELDQQSATSLETASQPQPESAEDVPDKCVAPGDLGKPGEVVAQPPKVDSAGKLVSEARKGARDGEENQLLTIANIKLLLIKLRGFEPGRSITASLQAEAQEFRQEKLNEILTAIATAPAGGEPDSRRALVAASIIRALKHFDALAGDELPSTSAVLIDLAAAKLRAANARIEAERLKRLATLADMKLSAVQREFIALAETRTLLTGTGPDSGRPLRSYANSWNAGRIQQQAIEAEMRNQAYFSWLERERAAMDASYAILEPAMSELKIYGDGGFKTSDIAAYLHAFGLGAVALGE